MNVQINSVNIRYQDGQVYGLQVYFSGTNEDRSVNLNGYIPLDSNEFNFDVEELQNVIKNKIIERLQETPVE